MSQMSIARTLPLVVGSQVVSHNSLAACSALAVFLHINFKKTGQLSAIVERTRRRAQTHKRERESPVATDPSECLSRRESLGVRHFAGTTRWQVNTRTHRKEEEHRKESRALVSVCIIPSAFVGMLHWRSNANSRSRNHNNDSWRTQ